MLNAIKFDESGLIPQADYETSRVWATSAAGDGVAVFFHNLRPDIRANLEDIDDTRRFFAQSARSAGLGVIEVDVVNVDGCVAVRTLFKFAQQPAGRLYIGALTFPFRDFSYVVKVQCPEVGVTGLRDTAVMGAVGGIGRPEIERGIRSNDRLAR